MTEYPRSEIELLLCCASPAGNGRRAERIRELSGQALDWEYLLQLAEDHALSPLLYWGLKSIRPEVVPDALARSFQNNTRNSIHLTGELLRLLDLFARAGIVVLPFKGPSLAVAAHGNLALRAFGDLDLLVHKEDAVRTREVLLKDGYCSDFQLNVKWEEAYLRAYDEFALRGPGGHPLVEVHWAVTPRHFSVPLDIASFWKRAESVNLGNREVPALCADDLFVVLCLHGTKHCWSRLSMVSDLAWLIAKRSIRWDDVMEQARRLGSVRMMLLGAELARGLLEAPLPQPVIRSIAADPGIQRLVEQVQARMFRLKGTVKSGGFTAQTIISEGSFHVQARERWLDRVRYFVRLATRTGVEDWQEVDLPFSLSFLYLLLRFPRLLRKYWSRRQ